MTVFEQIDPESGEQANFITRANGMNHQSQFAHKYVTAEIYPPSEDDREDSDVSIYVAVPGSPSSGVYIELDDLETVLRAMGYSKATIGPYAPTG